MKALRKKKETGAASAARYELNEFTTEFGAIVFDHTKGGNISNTNIYRLSDQHLWSVDFYVDKVLGTIKSIWLVQLSSTQLRYVDTLEMPLASATRTPSFDLSLWEEADGSQWPLINAAANLNIYHNGRNLIQLSFGQQATALALNEEIILQFDDDQCLTGVLIDNAAEVPKLLSALKA